MTYREFLKTLNARGNFRIYPRLDHIRKVLRQLGNPQDQYPAIHIAGTNGKGSVAASLESILRASGYRTGLYTSPHLIDLRERVQINGAPYSHGWMQAAEKVMSAESRAQSSLTYFEFLTALAFQAFADQHVDLAVIECGMGGQWDATNVLKTPLLSIITSIGMDHTEWLGKTKEKIAEQKAGIIKRNACVISGLRGQERAIIAQIAHQNGAKILQIDSDFKADSLSHSWRSSRQTISFLYKGAAPEKVEIGLLGAHQIDNAAITLAALKELNKRGWTISPEARTAGLRDVHWPGRLQMIWSGGTAPILLDGAHNPPAMEQLLKTVEKSMFRTARKTFVFSAFKDKDIETLGHLMAPAASEVCVCPLPAPRGADVARLSAALQGVKGPVRKFRNSKEALSGALRDTPQDGLVIVTGSLALVGQILKSLPSLPSTLSIHA